MRFTKMQWKNENLTSLQDRPVTNFCSHGTKPSFSFSNMEFLDEMKRQILKEASHSICFTIWSSLSWTSVPCANEQRHWYDGEGWMQKHTCSTYCILLPRGMPRAPTISVFRRVRIVAKIMSVNFVMSACPSTCISTAHTWRISVKFDLP
jgi:hypothetical protein